MPEINLQSVRDALTDQNFRELARAVTEGGLTIAEDSIEAKHIKAEAVGLSELSTAAENNFLRLATAAEDKIGFGSSTLTWSASTSSAAKEIAHGLGTTPTVILIQLNAGVLSSTVIETKGETNFKLKGFLNTSFTGSIGFDWVAIG